MDMDEQQNPPSSSSSFHIPNQMPSTQTITVTPPTIFGRSRTDTQKLNQERSTEQFQNVPEDQIQRGAPKRKQNKKTKEKNNDIFFATTTWGIPVEAFDSTLPINQTWQEMIQVIDRYIKKEEMNNMQPAIDPSDLEFLKSRTFPNLKFNIGWNSSHIRGYKSKQVEYERYRKSLIGEFKDRKRWEMNRLGKEVLHNPDLLARGTTAVERAKELVQQNPKILESSTTNKGCSPSYSSPSYSFSSNYDTKRSLSFYKYTPPAKKHMPERSTEDNNESSSSFHDKHAETNQYQYEEIHTDDPNQFATEDQNLQAIEFERLTAQVSLAVEEMINSLKKEHDDNQTKPEIIDADEMIHIKCPTANDEETEMNEDKTGGAQDIETVFECKAVQNIQHQNGQSNVTVESSDDEESSGDERDFAPPEPDEDEIPIYTDEDKSYHPVEEPGSSSSSKAASNFDKSTTPITKHCNLIDDVQPQQTPRTRYGHSNLVLRSQKKRVELN